MVDTREVPAVEVARTEEVPAIEMERTQAEPSEGAKTPPAKEEAEEDESLGNHLVECAKLTDLFLQVFCCNAKLFSRLWWSCQSRPPRSWPRGAPPSVGW